MRMLIATAACLLASFAPNIWLLLKPYPEIFHSTSYRVVFSLLILLLIAVGSIYAWRKVNKAAKIAFSLIFLGALLFGMRLAFLHTPSTRYVLRLAFICQFLGWLVSFIWGDSTEYEKQTIVKIV